MDLPVKINPQAALAFLGYRGQQLDDELRARLDRAVSICESALMPKGVYCFCSRVSPSEKSASGLLALDDNADIVVENNAERQLILPGKDIARHLAGCKRVALMAVTLGAESEMLLRREAAVNATDGLLVDACASAMTEQAANELNKLIDKAAADQGYAATSRYSPGYGDLPLSCQGAFLAACGADRTLGIRATEANLLIPAKSITAIIGLYPA